jgi:hypothetical protein
MISRYFTAAALVLVMYDAMITIDDEVAYPFGTRTRIALTL